MVYSVWFGKITKISEKTKLNHPCISNITKPYFSPNFCSHIPLSSPSLPSASSLKSPSFDHCSSISSSSHTHKNNPHQEKFRVKKSTLASCDDNCCLPPLAILLLLTFSLQQPSTDRLLLLARCLLPLFSAALPCWCYVGTSNNYFGSFFHNINGHDLGEFFRFSSLFLLGKY